MSTIQRFETIAELLDAAENGDVPATPVTITRNLFKDIFGLLDEMDFEIEEYGFISEGLASQVRSVRADVRAVAEREGL